MSIGAPLRKIFNRVRDQPEVHLVLGVIENGEGPFHSELVEQFLLTPETVRIAVIVQLGEAFAGEQDGVRWIASPLLQHSTGSFEEFGSQITDLLN